MTKRELEEALEIVRSELQQVYERNRLLELRLHDVELGDKTVS